MNQSNRYTRIIEHIFSKYYKEGQTQISFDRKDISLAAEELNIKLPKNLGDVIYSFRYRVELPPRIVEKAPKGYEWIIRPAGVSKYMFVAVKVADIQPNPNMAETKILNATPGVIDKYALNDEQALLAKLRYNRLIDVFTGLTCFSLQNHLRTSIKGIGQIETDEIYIGIDKRGVHYVIPVQAKGGSDKIGIVQIEQDIAMCATKFKEQICKPIAAQFMDSNLIALFEFEQNENSEIVIVAEKHYHLVLASELSAEELALYQKRVS